MSEKIGLFGHWHTGSTCLAKVFAAAGVEFGIEQTGFVNRVPGQERPVISSICSAAYHTDKKMIQSYSFPEFNLLDAHRSIRDILQAYESAAKVNGWEFYGIKNNHIILKYCWEQFGGYFADWEIILTLRHPVDICKTTDNNAWTDNNVVESWLDSVEVTKELVNNGAKLITFPFNVEVLRNLLKGIGLKYNKRVLGVYNRDKIRNISTVQQRRKFEDQYSGVKEAYEQLKKIAIG